MQPSAAKLDCALVMQLWLSQKVEGREADFIATIELVTKNVLFVFSSLFLALKRVYVYTISQYLDCPHDKLQAALNKKHIRAPLWDFEGMEMSCFTSNLISTAAASC